MTSSHSLLFYSSTSLSLNRCLSSSCISFLTYILMPKMPPAYIKHCPSTHSTLLCITPMGLIKKPSRHSKAPNTNIHTALITAIVSFVFFVIAVLFYAMPQRCRYTEHLAWWSPCLVQTQIPQWATGSHCLPNICVSVPEWRQWQWH